VQDIGKLSDGSIEFAYHGFVSLLVANVMRLWSKLAKQCYETEHPILLRTVNDLCPSIIEYSGCVVCVLCSFRTDLTYALASCTAAPTSAPRCRT